jgi:hypothetical protein
VPSSPTIEVAFQHLSPTLDVAIDGTTLQCLVKSEPVATAEIGTSALGASRAADEWSIVWQRLDYRSLRYVDDAGCDAGFYKIERLNLNSLHQFERSALPSEKSRRGKIAVAVFAFPVIGPRPKLIHSVFGG